MSRHDEILRILDRRETASAAELTRALGISPATLSRDLRQLQDQVCRLGRTRGARYARRRRVSGLPVEISVYRVTEEGALEALGQLAPLANGGHWLHAQAERRGHYFQGEPPFVFDMAPQGYLGAAFPRVHTDLDLPQRINDWSTDHRLIALARRGEDCVGNLLVGDESLNRLYKRWAAPQSAVRRRYPELSRHALEHLPGSSAGGEYPKFLTFAEEPQAHVLVKFTTGAGDRADARWRDLLAAEAIAGEVIATHQGAAAAPTALTVDLGEQRFLEVERFDRLGRNGRRAVISLEAVNAEYLGSATSWSTAAATLQARGYLTEHDARNMRWLDAFGQLIANSDRHFGNISFFYEDIFAERPSLRLAPSYDMLPMTFAPSHGIVPTDASAVFSPQPPDSLTHDVWLSAAAGAIDYWTQVADDPRISSDFQALAIQAMELVGKLNARFTGVRGTSGDRPD